MKEAIKITPIDIDYILKPIIENSTNNKKYFKDINFDSLNPEKHKIINNLEGELLVLAGPGTGKTTSIAYSVLKLLSSGISPNAIMLVTFSNKARNEMIKKIKELIGFFPNEILIGTFHSIGLRFIKRYKKHLKKTTILDKGDAQILIGKCIVDACNDELISIGSKNKYNLTEEEELKSLIKTYPNKKDIYKIISLTRQSFREINENKMLKIISKKCPSLINDVIDPQSKVLEIHRRYEKIKERQGSLDFEDLLCVWYDILKHIIESGWENHFKKVKYIFVDEYQDTNFIQDLILETFIKINKPFLYFVVGDDAQSIYGFRGSNNTNILNFKEKHPNCRTYELTQNYRSSNEILEFTNNSINHNQFQYKKKMWTDKRGENPLLNIYENEYNEINFIISEIKRINGSGIPFSKIAILLRVIKSESQGRFAEILENELVKNKIPYELRGGKLFEKAHIKDILSFLSILVNPKSIVGWTRMIKLIPRLGKKAISKITAKISEDNNPIAIFRAPEGGFIYSIGSNIPNINKQSLNYLTNIINFLFNLEGITVSERLSKLINNPKIFRLIDSKYKGKKNYEKRLEEIKQLPILASNFNSEQEFLEDFTLDKDLENDEKKEMIMVSTIHQAKGLEWDSVFVPCLKEDTIPDFRNKKTLTDLEEERRVFYVGISRSENRLILSFSRTSLSKHENSPSSFIEEINPDYYNKRYN